MILHYEKFEEQDYEVTITPKELVLFFMQVYGYKRDKANLIVGGIEKLELAPLGGLEFVVSADEKFYLWAKSHFERKARNELGYGQYLVCFLDGTGEYTEHEVITLQGAFDHFKNLVANGLPCEVHAHSDRKRGWVTSPIYQYERKKTKRYFMRKHL